MGIPPMLMQNQLAGVPVFSFPELPGNLSLVTETVGKIIKPGEGERR